MTFGAVATLAESTDVVDALGRALVEVQVATMDFLDMTLICNTSGTHVKAELSMQSANAPKAVGIEIAREQFDLRNDYLIA